MSSPSSASRSKKIPTAVSSRRRSRNGWTESVIHRDSKSSFRMSLQRNGVEKETFIAEKQPCGKYVVKQVMTNQELGALCKLSPSPSNLIQYSLILGNGDPVLLIDYEVPTLKEKLMDAPPRRARIEVNGKMTVESKAPIEKPSGKRGLDFFGRGRLSSRKNMQMTDPTSDKVVLQMVKWEKHQFHLDFA